MANINLLPWREQHRAEQNKQLLAACVLGWVLAAGIVFMVKLYMDSLIDHQNARNAYIQSEINKLSVIIKEIENLKEKRNAILSRMEIIQNLQANRAQIVHVFDDLVHKLPEGVYFDSVSKSARNISLKGKAQSNGRVSALMRNLDSSEWFDNPSLKVVDVNDQQGILISQFALDVKEESKSNTGDIDE